MGGAAVKLVDATLTTERQVGTASPHFGSTEHGDLTYPGPMVTVRTNMGFVFVSLSRKQVVDLRGFLAGKHGRTGRLYRAVPVSSQAHAPMAGSRPDATR